MENFAPVSSSFKQEKPNKKFLNFGIGVGIVYGLFTSIAAFPLMFFAFLITSIIFYQFLKEFEEVYVFPAISVLSLLTSLFLGGVIGFFSGRAAYRSANENGGVRNAGYGVLSCSIVGLVGLLLFPLLCAVLLVLLLGLTGSLVDSAAVFIIIIPPVFGVFTAYVVAVISGALTHRFLVRRSTVSKNDNKSEADVL